ncbi:MAG TPA: hypothetical protein ENH10_06585 [Bacteroidetes bacterium]|nr:hypothetical protein BMS3Bbin04_00967 [bacterium BMS3Bbin04]HDO65684.1 hypothetical protein [Bacteroidota bacterium]HEX04809.1 hypothetical protein [Bacteroidota bacterium]
MIDSDLLSVLVCPLSRRELVLDNDSLVSTDPATRRRYRIDDGIPVMLIEESEQITMEEWRQIMEKQD